MAFSIFQLLARPLKAAPQVRALSTKPLNNKPLSTRRRAAAKLRQELQPPERSHREELYASRRIEVHGATANHGLGRVFELMRSEGLVDKIRSRREWIRPGLVASLDRMKRRQQRFNAMVRDTVSEINEIYRRLQ